MQYNSVVEQMKIAIELLLRNANSNKKGLLQHIDWPFSKNIKQLTDLPSDINVILKSSPKSFMLKIR